MPNESATLFGGLNADYLEIRSLCALSDLATGCVKTRRREMIARTTGETSCRDQLP